jgi:protein tyrosine phosphatase (PTP) superfamily phosphohydrolase (DUF442 family)
MWFGFYRVWTETAEDVERIRKERSVSELSVLSECHTPTNALTVYNNILV